MHDLTRRHFMQLTAAAGLSAALPATATSPVVTDEDVRAVGAYQLGHASHAFEHLGGIGMQAEAAAACGATVIYATGIGGDGYEGLPAPEEWQRRLDAARAYTEKAKGLGIPLPLGYLCATSIVGLDDFDAHWTPEFRALFKTPPREWLQKDIDGNPLPSWYGGAYQPACMNHPDWRTYEKEMIRFQIQTGHRGIFFDNPTVHPKGCYCDHCMTAFGIYLHKSLDFSSYPGKPNPDILEVLGAVPSDHKVLRQWAQERRDDFRRFRTTIGRDFFAEMRAFARTLDPNAVVTANNSTNAPSVLYSQCNLYGYSPYEMSKAEDFVVVEDMSHQPRTTDDGKVFEYGPTLRQLQALCHGRPLVVSTIAEADYHTPPNLMRLAMAECAANQATYMVWSTWPEEHRARLSAAARKQVDFLRQNAHTYVGTRMRCDASLFFPLDGWLKSDTCKASEFAAEMTRANVQYHVFSRDNFADYRFRNVIYEDKSVLTDDQLFDMNGGSHLPIDMSLNRDTWMRGLKITSTIAVEGSPHVRAYVHDTQQGVIYVHLLNLDVRKRSSFTDEIFPAKDLRITLTPNDAMFNDASDYPKKLLASDLLTADDNTTRGPIACDKIAEGYPLYMEFTIPLLEVSAILAIKLGTA